MFLGLESGTNPFIGSNFYLIREGSSKVSSHFTDGLIYGIFICGGGDVPMPHQKP